MNTETTQDFQDIFTSLKIGLATRRRRGAAQDWRRVMIKGSRFAAIALGCFFMSGAGAALADPVHYFGHTLLIRRTTGEGSLRYRADHTFTLKTIAGPTLDGVWTAKDGKLCLTVNKNALAPFCVPDDPIHKVGDTWRTVSPDGIAEQLTLVPDR